MAAAERGTGKGKGKGKGKGREAGDGNGNGNGRKRRAGAGGPPAGAKRPRPQSAPAHGRKAPRDGGAPQLGRSAEARRKKEEKRNRRRPGTEPLIASLVKLWEKLRSPALDGDAPARHAIVGEMLSLLGLACGGAAAGGGGGGGGADAFLRMCTSHRSSRVVQSVFKHGNAEQRQRAAAALTPHAASLSHEQYGHFIVVRALDHTRGEARAGLVRALLRPLSNVRALAKTSHGSAALSSAYSYASAAQRQAMLAAFFSGAAGAAAAEGAGVRVMEAHGAGGDLLVTARGGYASVEALLRAEPGRRSALLAAATVAVRPALEKSLLDPPVVHQVLLTLLEAGGHVVLEDVRDNLCGANLLRMVHTREGARVACILVGLANARERKAIVKAARPQVGTIIRDDHGHLFLTSMLRNVDDTVLLKKQLIADILGGGDLYELLTHRAARVPLLSLVAPSSSRYITPAKREVLEAHAAVAGARARGGDRGTGELDDGDGDEEEEDDGECDGGGRAQPTSKKDPLQRRRELLGRGAASLGEAIVGVCDSHIDEMIASAHGTDVLFEVLRGGEGGLLASCVGEQRIKGVQSALIGSIASSSASPSAESPLEEYFCSRMLKRLLVLGSAPPAGDGATDASLVQSFAADLWRKVVRGQCAALVGTHAAKVLAALMFCGHDATVRELRKELTGVLKPKKVSAEAWAESLGLQSKK